MIDLSKCKQINPVHSEVEALFSVIYPTLYGLVSTLSQEKIHEIGGYDKLSLKMFTYLYEPGYGDCGICFEYAVHNAIVSKDNEVLDRIDFALSKFCKIKGDDPSSLLFGAEKTGQLQFIDTALENLTDDSLLLTGDRGKPIKLKKTYQWSCICIS